MRRRRAWAAGLAAAALGLGAVGCGGDDAPAADAPPAATPTTPGGASGAMPAGGGLGVAEARAAGSGPVLVRAFVFVATDGSAHLCDAAMESFPPRCAGARMPVTGLPPDLVAGLASQDGASWSDGPVQLVGAVRDGVFVNDPEALAAG